MNVNEMIGRLVCETDDGKMDGTLAKDVIDLLRALNKRAEAAEFVIENAGASAPASTDFPSGHPLAALAPGAKDTFVPAARPMGPFGMCIKGCGVMTGSPDKICSACRVAPSTEVSSESSSEA